MSISTYPPILHSTGVLKCEGSTENTYVRGKPKHTQADIQFGDMEDLLLLYKCAQSTLVKNNVCVVAVSPDIVQNAWNVLHLRWPERWTECMAYFDGSSKTFWARHAGGETHTLFVRLEVINLFGWDMDAKPFISYQEFLENAITHDRNPRNLANYDLPGVQATKEHQVDKSIVVCRYNMHLRSTVSKQMKEKDTRYEVPGVSVYEFKDTNKVGRVRMNSRDHSWRLMWLVTAKHTENVNNSGCAREKRRRDDMMESLGYGGSLSFPQIAPRQRCLAPVRYMPENLSVTRTPMQISSSSNEVACSRLSRLLESVVKENWELQRIQELVYGQLQQAQRSSAKLWEVFMEHLDAFCYLARQSQKIRGFIFYWRDYITGESLLHMAAKEGHVAAAQLLVDEYTIPLNVQKNNQSTPCHVLFFHHQWRILTDIILPADEPSLLWSATQGSWLPIQSAYNLSASDMNEKYCSPRRRLIRQLFWAATIDAGRRINIDGYKESDPDYRPIIGAAKYLRREFYEEREEFRKTGRSIQELAELLMNETNCVLRGNTGLVTPPTSGLLCK